jgi:hypothetical protein
MSARKDFDDTASPEDREAQAEFALRALDPDGLTDAIRAVLDERLAYFEQSVTDPGFDAVAYITKLVGADFVLAATAYLIRRRFEKRRGK